MPEGPEVRRNGEQLRALVKGHKLVKLEPISGKLSRQLSVVSSDETVRDVTIKGKAIFVKLDEKTLISTLGMSGWWYPELSQVDPTVVVYYQGGPISAVDVIAKALKHTRFQIITEAGGALYTDPRNFGNISLVSHDQAEAYAARLGVDLLGLTDPAEAVAALKKLAKRPIGEALVEQSVVCGLGNIYRAETLYLSRINPFRLVSDLSEEELTRLVEVGSVVLSIAYTEHGTMRYPLNFLSSLLGPALDEKIKSRGGDDVSRVVGHMVYGRPVDILGNEVNSTKSAGRTLWWVPALQT